MPKLLAVVRPEPGVGPTSATEIGEALELLFGHEGPFRIVAMTNTDWDAAGRQLPGVLASVVGLHLRRTDYLMRSQTISLALFFGLMGWRGILHEGKDRSGSAGRAAAPGLRSSRRQQSSPGDSPPSTSLRFATSSRRVRF